MHFDALDINRSVGHEGHGSVELDFCADSPAGLDEGKLLALEAANFSEWRLLRHKSGASGGVWEWPGDSPSRDDRRRLAFSESRSLPRCFSAALPTQEKNK